MYKAIGWASCVVVAMVYGAERELPHILTIPVDAKDIVSLKQCAATHKNKSLSVIVNEVMNYPELQAHTNQSTLYAALKTYWDTMDHRAHDRAQRCRTAHDPEVVMMFSARQVVHVGDKRDVVDPIIMVPLARPVDTYAIIMAHAYHKGRIMWKPLIEDIIKSSDMTFYAQDRAIKDDVRSAGWQYYGLSHAYNRGDVKRNVAYICGYAATVGLLFAPALAKRKPLRACMGLLGGAAACEAFYHGINCAHEYGADTDVLRWASSEELSCYRNHLQEYEPREKYLFEQRVKSSTYVPKMLKNNVDFLRYARQYAWWLFGTHMPIDRRIQRVDQEIARRS